MNRRELFLCLISAPIAYITRLRGKGKPSEPTFEFTRTIDPLTYEDYLKAADSFGSSYINWKKLHKIYPYNLK